jgi:hypothetical protein
MDGLKIPIYWDNAILHPLERFLRMTISRSKKVSNMNSNKHIPQEPSQEKSMKPHAPTQSVKKMTDEEFKAWAHQAGQEMVANLNARVLARHGKK